MINISVLPIYIYIWSNFKKFDFSRNQTCEREVLPPSVVLVFQEITLTKYIFSSVCVYLSPTFYYSKFDHLFFLLKYLRYFNIYNTNECSIKNYICENLMYLKIFFRKKNIVKIATVKVW